MILSHSLSRDPVMVVHIPTETKIQTVIPARNSDTATRLDDGNRMSVMSLKELHVHPLFVRPGNAPSWTNTRKVKLSSKDEDY